LWEAPVRVTDSSNGAIEILLPAEDFDWVRELLGDEPDAPRRYHPSTGMAFAVLAEQRYERFKAFFEEDPLSEAERMALFREAGKRAGWHHSDWKSSQEAS
jgi:hypothetical protein